MNILVNRSDLLTPLQQAIGVVERKQTLPVLGNLLFECHEGLGKLTTTDLEIELKASLQFTDTEDFSVTLPARKLLDICKALPDDSDINFDFSETQAKLSSGRSRFTLATLPASDFPSVDSIQPQTQFTIEQGKLKQLIDKTAFAMAQQDVRYYLNGMLLELQNHRIHLVATDGHRLAFGEYVEGPEVVTDRQYIIPRKAVIELSRLLKYENSTAQVLLSQNHIQILVDNLCFTSKLIDGKYPDYNRVIPLDGNKQLTIKRELLRQALQRISILSNEKYRGIRLTLEKDNLCIQANNPDQEEAVEEITVDYQDTTIEIGFNVTYLLDVLSVIDGDEVMLRFKDGNSSCILTAVDENPYKYIIMPIRL